MWQEEDCPICGKIMYIEKRGQPGNSQFWEYQCPDRIIPLGDNGSSHFTSLRDLDGTPRYETTFIANYWIESYPTASLIHTWKQCIDKRIGLFPYIKLPWNDPEQCLLKIKTYLLFS